MAFNEKEKKIVECPYLDCDEILFYEEGIFGFDFNFECEKGHKFCGKCKLLVHHDDACKTVWYN